MEKRKQCETALLRVSESSGCAAGVVSWEVSKTKQRRNADSLTRKLF